MPRIRTIKPEIVHSQSLARVSRDARLTFVLLITQADDLGRLAASSRMLASILFPCDEDARTSIDGWLDELEREGCIRRYVVDGTEYIDLPKWQSHQRIDRPTPSKLPGFDEGSTRAREDSMLDLGPRIIGPRIIGPLKSEQVDRGGRALKRADTGNGRGSRLPADWTLTAEWRDIAANARQRNRLPQVNLDLEAEKFANHWHGQSGAKASKSDWLKTWTNWALRAEPPRGTAPQAPTDDELRKRMGLK